jgi:hypothetical protein
MSTRRPPAKEPAPALSGTLDRIRRGRAGNEALEVLFGGTTDEAAPPEGASSAAATTDTSTTDTAADTAAGATPDRDTEPGVAPEPVTGTAGVTPQTAEPPTPAEAPVTATPDEVVAAAPAPTAAPSPAGPTPGTPTRARRSSTRPPQPSAATTAAGNEPAPGPTRSRRPSGIPFTVLLDRRLRAKVHAWVLAHRRNRQRPSNSALLVSAASRWDRRRAEEFLDWFEQYEPIGMATPDASRFSARVEPELVETLEVVCAELAVDHDLRIPRQALMMFLLDEELDAQLRALEQ